MLTSFKVFLFTIVAILPSFGPISTWKNNLSAEILPKTETVAQENFKLPGRKLDYPEISSNSKAAYFQDVKSGEVLYAKNPEEKLQIASLTKLMTALVVASKDKGNEVYTTPALGDDSLDSVMGLSAGDKLTVNELMHGLMINSGSDAAKTLAIGVSGSEGQFVNEMNKFANELGLTNTHFSNVVGYDDQQNYSTAEDMAKLAKLALMNPKIKEIAAKKTYTAKSVSGKSYLLSNTNKLLDASFKGLKTGTTYGAGECLISIYKEGDKEIIGVLLGSPDRFGETSSIIKWTREAFSW